MTNIVFRKRSRLRAFGQAFCEIWRASGRRRQQRRQMRSIEYLDDFRRRDIGLPARGTPVRTVYCQW